MAGVVASACGSAEEAGDTSALSAKWGINPEPSLSIGAMSGEEVYNLDGVSYVVRLSDQSLAVSSVSARTITIFDATGTYLRTLGGEGDGPGEFTNLRSLWRGPGDTLGVFDANHQRISFFLADGSLLPSVQVKLEEGTAEILAGALPGGTFAVARFDRPNMTFGDSPEGDPMIVSHIRNDGTEIGEIARLGGMQRIKSGRGGTVLPFTTWLVHAVVNNWLAVGNGETSTLLLFDPSTNVQKSVEWDSDPIMTVGQAWEYFDSFYAGERDDAWSRLQMSGFYDQYRDLMPRTDPLPSYSALLGDTEGRIWVKRYDPIADNLWTGKIGGGPGGSWLVLSTEGDILATVDMPDRFTPKEIGADYVVGVWRDENDVEYVHLHTLIRGG